MSDNSKWIGTLLDNRNLITLFLLSLVCFLLALLLLVSAVVRYFPPINPYGYALSNGAGNILLVAGIILIFFSMVLYILGTKNAQESAQQIRGGISYLYLRQYLLSRVNIKSDITYKLGEMPTPKSIVDITYLLNETPSEIILLRSMSPHLLLLLEEESDPNIATEIIEIIGKTRTPNTEKVLIDYYKKDHFDEYFDAILKTACVTALGELGSSKSRRALEKILENPHKLVGRVLGAIIRSMKKFLVLSEFTQLLKSLLFDERIQRNIRETYILSAIEQIGTEESVNIANAYQFSKLESISIKSAYEQVISKQNKRGEK